MARIRFLVSLTKTALRIPNVIKTSALVILSTAEMESCARSVRNYFVLSTGGSFLTSSFSFSALTYDFAQRMYHARDKLTTSIISSDIQAISYRGEGTRGEGG